MTDKRRTSATSAKLMQTSLTTPLLLAGALVLLGKPSASAAHQPIPLDSVHVYAELSAPDGTPYDGPIHLYVRPDYLRRSNMAGPEGKKEVESGSAQAYPAGQRPFEPLILSGSGLSRRHGVTGSGPDPYS